MAVVPMRFSQISSPVLRIQRLHDVAGIVDEHDAVVDQGSGLIGAFVHGPDPLQLQILHVLRGDLVQRAVIVGVIIVPDHQPVAGIGIAQHGVGDRRVVLHFAGDRQDLAAWPEPALPRVRPAASPARRLCRAGRPAQPARAVVLWRSSGWRPCWRPSAVGSRPRAVRIQNERGDVEIRLLRPGRPDCPEAWRPA